VSGLRADSPLSDRIPPKQLIAGGISGFIAEAISYQGVFAISVAIALISVAVIVKTLTIKSSS
jgi:hypothetical protein